MHFTNDDAFDPPYPPWVDTRLVARHDDGKVHLKALTTGDAVADPFRGAQNEVKAEATERSMCQWCRFSKVGERRCGSRTERKRLCMGPPNPEGSFNRWTDFSPSARGKCQHYSPSLLTRFLRLPVINKLGIRQRSFIFQRR